MLRAIALTAAVELTVALLLAWLLILSAQLPVPFLVHLVKSRTEGTTSFSVSRWPWRGSFRSLRGV